MDIKDITKLLELLQGGNNQKTVNQSFNCNDYGMKGKYVLIRTYSAGVHFGILEEKQGDEVVLKDAQRIYTWSGAFTLSAVAMEGIKDGKISMKVDRDVLKWIEIIPLSEKAQNNLTGFKIHNP